MGWFQRHPRTAVLSLLPGLALALLWPAAMMGAEGAESTTSASVLRVISHTLLVASATQKPPELRMLELIGLENTSDRDFISRPGGSAGPMGLLRFSLPPGAYDLAAGGGLEGQQLIQVDRGFATILTVPPGQHELSFAYRVPYDDTSYAFSKSIIYPTAEFRVLWRDRAATLEADGLKQSPDVEIGGARFHVAVAQNLAAGSRLQLRLSELPAPTRPWPWERQDVLRWTVLLPAAVGLALALLVALRRATRSVAVPPAEERERLFERIVELERGHRAGLLDDCRYQRERAATKRRLLALLRGQQVQPL